MYGIQIFGPFSSDDLLSSGLCQSRLLRIVHVLFRILATRAVLAGAMFCFDMLFDGNQDLVAQIQWRSSTMLMLLLPALQMAKLRHLRASCSGWTVTQVSGEDM